MFRLKNTPHRTISMRHFRWIDDAFTDTNTWKSRSRMRFPITCRYIRIILISPCMVIVFLCYSYILGYLPHTYEIIIAFYLQYLTFQRRIYNCSLFHTWSSGSFLAQHVDKITAGVNIEYNAFFEHWSVSLSFYWNVSLCVWLMRSHHWFG